jgi:hypothetical protein
MYFAVADNEVRLGYERVNASGKAEKSEQVLEGIRTGDCLRSWH